MSQLISRRKMLDWVLGLGGAGVVFVTAWPLVRYTIPPKGAAESGDWINAGRLDEVKASGSKDIVSSSGQPVILVINDSGELVALEKKCPHLGCMVQLGKDELVCPCHGGKFTLDGQLISGPPPRGLRKYQVEVRGGSQIFVGKELA